MKIIDVSDIGKEVLYQALNEYMGRLSRVDKEYVYDGGNRFTIDEKISAASQILETIVPEYIISKGKIEHYHGTITNLEDRVGILEKTIERHLEGGEDY